MAGGAWREKGFTVKNPSVLDHVKVLPGKVEPSLNSTAMLGMVYLFTAFILGAVFATAALWLVIPYLPFAGGR